MPVISFYTHLKTSENLWFYWITSAYIYRGYKKRPVAWNELVEVVGNFFPAEIGLLLHINEARNDGNFYFDGSIDRFLDDENWLSMG